MDPADLTIRVLQEIRDEVREVKVEARKTNERLDQTNERLDQTNQRLDRIERRQTESETRLASDLVAVTGAVNQVRDLLATRPELRDRVDDHERRIASLEQRSGG